MWLCKFGSNSFCSVIEPRRNSLNILQLPSGVISWYKEDQELSGETSDTLTFTPVSTSDEGEYHCRSTFPTTGQFVYGGVTRSEDITLTVHREFFHFPSEFPLKFSDSFLLNIVLTKDLS